MPNTRTKHNNPSHTPSAKRTQFFPTMSTTSPSATGRRKTAVSRVWLTEGTGQITSRDLVRNNPYATKAVHALVSDIAQGVRS